MFTPTIYCLDRSSVTKDERLEQLYYALKALVEHDEACIKDGTFHHFVEVERGRELLKSFRRLPSNVHVL